MIILSTAEITDPGRALTYGPNEINWLYNGVDSAVTKEVDQVLMPQVYEDPDVAYTYERALEKIPPLVEMNTRGIRVNQTVLKSTRMKVLRRQLKIIKHFDHICEGVFGKTYNPNSPVQLAKLLYDDLQFPKYRNSRSTDEAHLEQLKKHFNARPWCNMILALRDCASRLKLLNTKLTRDGRFTYMQKVTGTVTGRLSCGSSAKWIGNNGQNVHKLSLIHI